MEKAQGYIDIITSKSTNYSFVLDSLTVVINQNTGRYQAQAKYTSLSCYRPTESLVADLNDEYVCKDFKPMHARIIIGLDTLEKTLDFTLKDQVNIYLLFLKKCKDSISI